MPDVKPENPMGRHIASALLFHFACKKYPLQHEGVSMHAIASLRILRLNRCSNGYSGLNLPAQL